MKSETQKYYNTRKRRLYVRVRRESTMTLKWIAQRLHMGIWTYVSNCLAMANASK
jgi:hypothetical protein